MKQDNDPLKSQYPALGRWLMWVERPKAASCIFWTVAAICLILIALDLFYHKHGHFMVEDLFGFYGFYGFFMCAGLVIAAKIMRIFLMRDEDYYAPHSVENEAHPEFDLARETVNQSKGGQNS